MTIELHNSDCLDTLSFMPDNSVDALVTDPPAGISFMGKSWDHDKGGRKQWIAWMTEVMTECMRVMKPGAHGLVWAIPRTSHWTGAALEDAGFRIKDRISHLYGSGFPKSTSVGKQAYKAGMLCQCSDHEKKQTSSDLSALQDSISTKKPDSLEQGKILQHEVRRCREGIESNVCCSPTGDCTQGPCRVDEGVNEELFAKDDWRQESGVDGWKVCGTSKGLRDDTQAGTPEGTPQRLCAGAHPSDGGQTRATVEVERSGPPYQPQPIGQQAKKSDALQGPQDALGETPQVGLHCGKCGKLTKETEGWGSHLKPACEDWWLVQKPLEKGLTISANVLKWGVGGLNIDGCRIEGEPTHGSGVSQSKNSLTYNDVNGQKRIGVPNIINTQGRFPANLIISHNPECEDDQCSLGCAAAMLDEQSLAGGMHSAGKARPKQIHKGDFGVIKHGDRERLADNRFGDVGGASRFFYCAKTSTSERNAGLEGMEERVIEIGDERPSGNSWERRGRKSSAPRANHHPTVKPQKLMRYLCRLITPPSGVVLDPFMGSGSTGLAALSEGFRFIGIEKEQEYFEIAKTRINNR